MVRAEARPTDMFFPKQFTVGVPDPFFKHIRPFSVAMSALFRSLCFQIFTFVSQLRWWCPPFSGSLCFQIYLCALNLCICLPAWIVMSALLGSLCSPFFTCVSRLVCPPFWDLAALPAWVVVLALLEALSFGFSPFVFQLGLSSSPNF